MKLMTKVVMRTGACLVALLMLVSCAGSRSGKLRTLPARADHALATKPCRLAVKLSDGSVIVGTYNRPTLPFHGVLGRMELPAKNIRSVCLLEDKEHVRIDLKNGDSLTALPEFHALQLTTSVGRVSIELNQLQRLDSLTGGISREGLVAEYLFQGDARDSVAGGLPGMVHGATLTADRFGRRDSAYRFNGEQQWIEVPASRLTGALPALTIALWARADTVPGSQNLILVTKQPSGSCAANPSPVTSNHGGLFDFELDNGALYFCSQVNAGMESKGIAAEFAPFEVGQWMHLAVVADSRAKRVEFYVNGRRIASKPTQHALLTVSTSEPLRIGCRKDSCYTQSWFNGALDDLLIFDRALTAADIEQLYRGDPSED